MCTHGRLWQPVADGVTGEVFKQRLVPANEVVIDWLRGLPGPVAVTYEPGRPGLACTGCSARHGSVAKWPRR